MFECCASATRVGLSFLVGLTKRKTDLPKIPNCSRGTRGLISFSEKKAGGFERHAQIFIELCGPTLECRCDNSEGVHKLPLLIFEMGRYSLYFGGSYGVPLLGET